MSENMEELKRQFIKMAQRHNQQLGSVLRVCCEVKPDIKKGILVLSPEPEVASVLTDNVAIIDRVSREVFGKTMVVAISLPRKQARAKTYKKKQEMAPAPAIEKDRSMVTSGPEEGDEEAIRYLLDHMCFENVKERQRIADQLRRHIRMSMSMENVARRKEGKKEAGAIRDLKMYKIPAILQESHDRPSLEKALKKHLGKNGLEKNHVSKFIRLCGGFPWKCSFDVGEYNAHGKRMFLGIRDKNYTRAEVSRAEAKIIPAQFAGNQAPESVVTPIVTPVPAPAPADTGKSPREIALEEEIGKLRDRIDYFERLFEDHIHDVRTGQPYRPVKLGLVSSDKPA